MSGPRTYKVLHLTDHLNLGGVQTFLLNLLGAWEDPRFVHRAAALYGPGKHHEAFVRAGADPVYAARSKRDPLLPLRLAGLLRRAAPDIIHASGVPSCMLAETLRGVCPQARLITHLQSTYRQHDSQPYQNFVEPLCHRHSDRVIACSLAVLDGFSRNVPVSIVHNGIDLARLAGPPDVQVRAARRRAAGFGDSDFVIGSTGRLVYGKDPGTLCEAFVQVLHRHPHARLLWVGDGPLRAELWESLHRAGAAQQAHCTGFVPAEEVGDWLHAMDLFAFPSLREGLPLSLVEAMHCGLPCVSADFPAAAEVITDGLDGVIVPRRDAGKLADAIAALADDPARRAALGSAARESVRVRFSSQRMAREMAAAYCEVLGIEG